MSTAEQAPPQQALIQQPPPRQLSVLGSRRVSLFDRVRPAEVQAAGRKIRGPGGMALASLHFDGVTGGTVRTADAVVLGGRVFGTRRPGWHDTAEGMAIGLAYGIAVVRRQRGLGGHTWCIIRTRALREGRTLEAATALVDLPPAGLVVIVAGPDEDKDRSTGLLRGCGLAVAAADNADAWSVISALDRASTDSNETASAVIATRGEG